MLTGSTSGEFTLWNGLTFNFETILQAHDTAVCAFSFTHSGAYLASTDKAGVIKYFQPNMNNLTAWPGSRSREAIRGLSFSPDDSRFATASDDSSVRIWSFEESREESVLTGIIHADHRLRRHAHWHTQDMVGTSNASNGIQQKAFWYPEVKTTKSSSGIRGQAPSCRHCVFLRSVTFHILTTPHVSHQHKNTVQAVSWSPHGNFVASASRDQTVRVFDIRAMKEFRVLKGHKKEVCCKSFISTEFPPSLSHTPSPAVTWHPVHPILVSGGSEGAILHWDISAPEPTTTSMVPASHQPRATLSQAHDSNVWSIAFHPLGHLLASASNDHTTRFWSRERPGDASSVFSGGGEKPPEIVDTSGQDDEDENMVPGFSYSMSGGGGGAGGGIGSGWWNKEEEAGGLFSSSDGDYARRVGGGGGGGLSGLDEQHIPGFGIADNVPISAPTPVLGRQSGPLPPQEDLYGAGGGEEWGRNGGRQNRWSGSRRGRP